MAALSALAMALTAASTVAGVVTANQAKSDAKKQARKQEIAAKEAAALETPMKKTDPNYQLGTNDPASKVRTAATRGTKPAAALATGGLSASSVGGL